MKDLYSIGDVAKYANINTSALRYYDEIGLVSPSFRNPETGYRYYSASDLWKLEIIQTIKKLGVPIEQIKDVITSNSSEKFYELLKLQREKAVENLKQLTALVDDLSSMIESFESIEEILPSPVVKKKINKRYALATDSGIADFDSDTLHFELRKKLDSSVMSNQIKKHNMDMH